MRVTIRPKTPLGAWSVGLLAAAALLFAAAQGLVASGQRGGETFTDNLALSIPLLLMTVCAVLAFLMGIVGIVRSKERSVFVFLATLIGLVVLVFMIGELLGPE